MNGMDKTVIKNTCIRTKQSPSPDSDCCNFIYDKLLRADEAHQWFGLDMKVIKQTEYVAFLNLDFVLLDM